MIISVEDFAREWVMRAGQDIEEMRIYWDGRADDFNKYTATKDRGDMQEIVDYLKSKGALNKEDSVIDIGCGSGRHSLTFASLVSKVVGNDLSPKMIEHCKNNAKELNIKNTEFEALPWQDVDLEEKGYVNKFELAFSSMSPAISSIETLDKLIAASNKHCFVSGFIYRTDELSDYLLNSLNIVKSEAEHNIYYILNILWKRGIYPELLYKYIDRDHYRKKELELDDALRSYTASLRKYTDSETLEDDIKKLLEKKIENGKIISESTARRAWLYWRVDEES